MKIKLEFEENDNSELKQMLDKAIENSNILKSKNASMWGYFDFDKLNNELECKMYEFLKYYIKTTGEDVKRILIDNLIENERKRINKKLRKNKK